MRQILIILLAGLAAPALAKVPLVVTDIPPVHALVAQVMSDLGTPVLLLDRGASEHDFQLRPSQASALATADLVVWVGPELTPWLDRALALRPEGSAALSLLHAPGTVLQSYKDVDDPADTGLDPHAWLDPDNARLWLPMIAEALARRDPENAAIYAVNAATAVQAINQLDATLAATLSVAQGKTLVPYHDAYGYFARHFGLTMAASIASGDATTPGAGHLQSLRAKIEAGQVVCLFPEAQHDPALILQLADGTGARIGAALDPVGSTLEPGPGAYAALLAGLAETIASCVAGP